MRYYIAYGSNLHVAQMRRRCPDAVAVGTAWLDNYRLAFRGSKTGAYLTILPDKRTRVPVGIWAISEDDERNLDRYEGYPTFYGKHDETITLQRFDGTTEQVTAMVYTMRADAPKGTPSQSYVNTCSVGYDCFGLPQEYLLRAVKSSLPKRSQIRANRKKVTA